MVWTGGDMFDSQSMQSMGENFGFKIGTLICLDNLWQPKCREELYQSLGDDRKVIFLRVLVCGDCPSSKLSVLVLAQRLGFRAVDAGGLCASGALEEAPLLLFPSWRGPLLAAATLFTFFYLYTALKNVLMPYLDRGENNLYHLPLVTVNQALPAVALVTLALVYLPGLLASVLQLYRGTKYKRFPDWLDRWMCARKQLGLLSFLCAALHAVYSVCLSIRRASGYMILNAAYRQVKAGVENSWVETQVWRSDLYLSSGILGLGVLCVLALTSLPSVGHALNWREFTFVQVRQETALNPLTPDAAQR
ncbi:metalloreductase STEAP3-like [Boleophthalmus pectinirostris]|uniref:metalloreductase STEAP3-like n=1 Tax=Boleophthalmus pectinirostris TaxID=150288 RepID=UPI002430B92B|nr:metalloreductase STEAP3-like [Boleophthalmus pectinirostris]